MMLVVACAASVIPVGDHPPARGLSRRYVAIDARKSLLERLSECKAVNLGLSIVSMSSLRVDA
jgi:hypothetical protein